MRLPASPSAVLAVGLALYLVPTGTAAQASPLVIEVRNGVAAPVSSFREADAGRSFGMTMVLSGAGRRAVYGGFSQHHFGCASAGCVTEDAYTATGFDVGFRIDLRTRGSVIPWLRLGLVTTQVELPRSQATEGDLSSLGFGGELGAGLYMGVSSPLALVPGVRVTAVNTELPGGTLLRMRYVVAELALALAF